MNKSLSLPVLLMIIASGLSPCVAQNTWIPGAGQSIKPLSLSMRVGNVLGPSLYPVTHGLSPLVSVPARVLQPTTPTMMIVDQPAVLQSVARQELAGLAAGKKHEEIKRMTEKSIRALKEQKWDPYELIDVGDGAQWSRLDIGIMAANTFGSPKLDKLEKDIMNLEMRMRPDQQLAIQQAYDARHIEGQRAARFVIDKDVIPNLKISVLDKSQKSELIEAFRENAVQLIHLLPTTGWFSAEWDKIDYVLQGVRSGMYIFKAMLKDGRGSLGELRISVPASGQKTKVEFVSKG